MLIGGRVHGFIFSDYPQAVVEAKRDLSQWLSEGKIQRAEHLVKGSMDDLEATWKLLYTGTDKGKCWQYLSDLGCANHFAGKLILQVKNPEE